MFLLVNNASYFCRFACFVFFLLLESFCCCCCAIRNLTHALVDKFYASLQLYVHSHTWTWTHKQHSLIFTPQNFTIFTKSFSTKTSSSVSSHSVVGFSGAVFYFFVCNFYTLLYTRIHRNEIGKMRLSRREIG